MVDREEEAENEKELYLLTSPGDNRPTRQLGSHVYKAPAVSPFRTTLEKVLVVVAFVLLIVCIVVIALLAVEKGKGSQSGFEEYYDRDTSCLYSDEAKRVGLQKFLKKVQTTFYEYNRAIVAWESSVTVHEVAGQLKERYLPLNVTPAYLKLKTDVAFSLLDEINEIDMDENKMKSREVKAVQQVKLFLRTVFGSPYDQNFYDGDWLMGPNHFCWQPICSIGSGIYRYAYYVKPESAEELVEILRRLRLVGETVKQYM